MENQNNVIEFISLTYDTPNMVVPIKDLMKDFCKWKNENQYPGFLDTQILRYLSLTNPYKNYTFDRLSDRQWNNMFIEYSRNL